MTSNVHLLYQQQPKQLVDNSSEKITKIKILFFFTTEITKEKKQEDVNRFLKEQYDISHTIPAVFLDNFPDWEDLTEKEMTNKELQTLKDLASAMPPFSCQDAEVTRWKITSKIDFKTLELNKKSKLKMAILCLI